MPLAIMTVNVTEPAATVHAMAPTMAAAAMHAMAPTVTAAAAAMAASECVVGPKQSKAERSARSDGQQCRLPKHSVLLCDPLGIDESPIRALVGWLFQKVQDPAKGHVWRGSNRASRDKQGPAGHRA
jgi:hypothetical protein